MKKVRYFFEAVALNAFLLIFTPMPVTWASAIGGKATRCIGLLTKANKRADRHMQLALPEMDEAARKKALGDMWENLGRTICEYPHLRTIIQSRVEVSGKEISQKIVDQNKGALFIGGHFANWEVLVPFFKHYSGIDMALTYRQPNNKWVGRLLERMRRKAGITMALRKSDRKTGPRLVHTLKNGGFAGMLVDQKYNEGIPIDFFKQKAMTNPIAVRLARKFDVPLVMTRIERLPKVRFLITVLEPLKIENRSDEEVLLEINSILESWIRQRTGQWMWLHRRWGNMDHKHIRST